MTIRYDAYLVRHWHLADGQERIEILALASGERRRCRSLAEACGWITARGSERAPPTEHGDTTMTAADRAETDREGAQGS